MCPNPPAGFTLQKISSSASPPFGYPPFDAQHYAATPLGSFADKSFNQCFAQQRLQHRAPPLGLIKEEPSRHGARAKHAHNAHKHVPVHAIFPARLRQLKLFDNVHLKRYTLPINMCLNAREINIIHIVGCISTILNKIASGCGIKNLQSCWLQSKCYAIIIASFCSSTYDFFFSTRNSIFYASICGAVVSKTCLLYTSDAADDHNSV